MDDGEYGVSPNLDYQERAREAATALGLGGEIIERLFNGENISLEKLAEELGIDEEDFYEQLQATLDQIRKYTEMEDRIATASLTKAVSGAKEKLGLN